ncbi:MAG: hypothetical protein E4G99_00730 [Anaerolineales bacterium]|nr:MAG: hypothetical protein E4G99_00730 [Anaerolineales bacterium]
MPQKNNDLSILELPINQLIKHCPQLVGLFILHRLACIGCSFSGFHNFHQAIQLHSIAQERAAQLEAQVIAECNNPTPKINRSKGVKDAP